MHAARGSQLNSALTRCHASWPLSTPSRSWHSVRNPNRALMSVASWLPVPRAWAWRAATEKDVLCCMFMGRDETRVDVVCWESMLAFGESMLAFGLQKTLTSTVVIVFPYKVACILP